jgi:hypothetical protein
LRPAEWVIIESNSIVEHIDPLLYLVVLDASQTDFKPSARRALDRADAHLFVTAPGIPVDSRPWQDLGPALLTDKPSFHVCKPAFWNPALREFVGKRLGVT